MSNSGFAKAFNAATAIPAYRIVAASGSEDCALASSSTDKLLGISTSADTAVGFRVDAILEQTAELKLGGTVEMDDPITSDASGCGVLADPDPGEKLKIVGFALAGGVSGDIVQVKVQPGYVTG